MWRQDWHGRLSGEFSAVCSGGGSAATWYLHFNCGGDPTCISTPGNGSNTGIFQDFSSSGDNQGACEGGRIPFDNLGEAKTSWCSTSSNMGDPSLAICTQPAVTPNETISGGAAAEPIRPPSSISAWRDDRALTV